MLDNPFRRLIEPPDQIVGKLMLTSEMTVVDFGCGPGHFILELAKRSRKVVAVDLQAGMLKKAKHKAEKAGVCNVEFLQSNGAAIELPDSSVDLIMLFTVFHEIGDSTTVLKEFSRILKPSGKVAIVEVIKKMYRLAAPLQNPDALQAKVESEGTFKLEKIEPYKSYGIFFFKKNAEATKPTH